MKNENVRLIRVRCLEQATERKVVILSKKGRIKCELTMRSGQSFSFEGAAFPACFLHEPDAFNSHFPVYRLAHVVDGEARSGNCG